MPAGRLVEARPLVVVTGAGVETKQITAADDQLCPTVQEDGHVSARRDVVADANAEEGAFVSMATVVGSGMFAMVFGWYLVAGWSTRTPSHPNSTDRVRRTPQSSPDLHHAGRARRRAEPGAHD